MEQAIIDLVSSYPKAVAIYGVIVSAYWLVCAVATLTSTTKDDEFLAKWKQFFSIPIKPKQ